MDAAAVTQLFQPLWDELKDFANFPRDRPLLAHYTTVQTLEKILANNEVWFSNPLFMNDFEEVRFGINQGHELVLGDQEIAEACRTPERAATLKNAFAAYYNKFANEHALDTYVFCLSYHDKEDNDGRLSMWRGYGANGNGVALVFDTAQLESVDSSPLIIAPVVYATTEARMNWLRECLKKFTVILNASNIPDDKLYIAAYLLFERIKLFALFSKHHGFKEENEWRVVYMPDRDTEQKLKPMFHYAIGPRGVEPKLKFKIQPISGMTVSDLSLAKITDRIILGPSISSPVALATMQRMLDVLNQSAFKAKLRASTIPFRAIS